MCAEEVWVQLFCGRVLLVVLNVEVSLSHFSLLLTH